VLPHYLGNFRRPNLFKITSDTALKHITDDKNETFHVTQLHWYWYCSIILKNVYHLFAHMPEDVNATRQMKCQWCMFWLMPFRRFCFSLSMLCIRDWNDLLLNDPPYLAKTRLRFGLFGGYRFSQKKEVFLPEKSCSNLCSRYTSTTNI